MLYRFVAQISLDRRFHWRACSHRYGAACADGFSKPATSPARSTIDWKPWLVNGVPRSLINAFYEQYSSIYQFLESKREAACPLLSPKADIQERGGRNVSYRPIADIAGRQQIPGQG